MFPCIYRQNAPLVTPCFPENVLSDDDFTNIQPFVAVPLTKSKVIPTMAVARWSVLNRRYHSGILAWGLGHDRSRTALPYTNVASWIETPTVRRRSSHPGVIPSTTRWNLLPAWSVQTSARRCYSGSNMDLAQRLARKGNTALYKKR